MTVKECTALELAQYVMESLKRPVTADDIWSFAIKNNISSTLRGKTPARTIQAQLYVNIKRTDSRFCQIGKRPPMFYLKGETDSPNYPYPEPQSAPGYNERKLHPLLVSFVANDPHFRCHCMTIRQETSKKGSKNTAKWLHPDIVGVYFPFNDFDSNTVDLFKTIGQSLVKLFSFEMKKIIDRSNVREYYFQAISNSSWAHEGYLVALDIKEEAREELRGLNETFGIGIIQLNAEDISQSEILFPSKIRDTIDSYMIDRLVSENHDFNIFIQDILDNSNLKRLKGGSFDGVMDDEQLSEYCKNEGIL